GSGVVALVWIAIGCGAGPPPDVASPAFEMEPEHVCRGESSEVTLDASPTTSDLTLVPAGEGETELDYDWRLRGASYEVVEGALDQKTVTVRTSGERPLHVRLRVDKPGGKALEVEQSLAITVA
ncbi:MAG: hypothetical protein ABEL76_02605, partial [Bradymonadaceae bacterium]